MLNFVSDRGRAGLFVSIAALMLVGSVGSTRADESTNELMPNGSFERIDADGKTHFWRHHLSGGGFSFQSEIDEDGADNRVLEVVGRAVFEWEPRNAPIWGSRYVLRMRAKGQGLNGCGMNVWTRLPLKHLPPNGNQTGPRFSRTFDWKDVEMPLEMPAGVTRFIIFVDGVKEGALFLDDVSIVPVDDRPLVLDEALPAVGDGTQEPFAWVWSRPGFPWSAHHMARDVFKPVDAEAVSFRRTIAVPAGVTKLRATFVGDDHAVLSVNGEAIAENRAAQEIRNAWLDAEALAGGEHTFQFDVDNRRGPAGLLARITWQNEDGSLTHVPTNENWERSNDGGTSWQPASMVALPAPAPALDHWAYDHLPKHTLSLSHELPEDATGVRLALRASNAVRIALDGQERTAQTSGGQAIKLDLGTPPSPGAELTLTLGDVALPPIAQGVLEITTPSGEQQLGLHELKLDGGESPVTVAALFPDRTWPVNVGSFAAASTLPEPNIAGGLEPWADALLEDGTELFAIGEDDGQSEEFAELGLGTTDIPVNDATSTLPRGLEKQTQPELTLRFALTELPEHGAAFQLDVEDADAIVSTVGVFVNGILVGTPTTFGYDLVPGERKAQRTAIVTLAPERLRVGENTLTLRLMPMFYDRDAEALNQAEEYINQLRLGDRDDNPYPTANWLHWDHLRLVALAVPPSSPINGRPIWLGTNRDWWYLTGVEPWRSFVPRDYAWLGLSDTDAPVRYGIWEPGQYKRVNKSTDGLPDGETGTGYHLRSLRELGTEPLLLYEPGRTMDTPDDFDGAHETEVLRDHADAFDYVEIGNEVDHPKYGWNAMNLALGWATTMKQAAVAQRLKQEVDPELTVVGQGWYHAWDFSVIDAQARKETDDDPAFTDHLAGHSYGKSYVIPAVQYYLLYGTTPPKPIWITECGSWTEDDIHIRDFELNLRGNLAFATYIVQFQSHANKPNMERFGMIRGASDQAEVLEKARCFRRLQLAYGMHGTPLPWTHTDPEAMADVPVMVRAVHTERGRVRIGFVNETHEPQDIDVTVTLPASSTYHGQRFGDTARLVVDGIRDVTLDADPSLRLIETLQPGEAVEYLLDTGGAISADASAH